MGVDAQILRLNGKISHESIRINYDGDSLNQKRAEYVTVSGQLADLRDRKKAVLDDFKEEMKPIEVEAKRLLDITRKGYELVHKEVKLIANDEDGTIEFYDKDSGEFLGQRKQYPEERVFAIEVVKE
jgi:hypothetical protein